MPELLQLCTSCEETAQEGRKYTSRARERGYCVRVMTRCTRVGSRWRPVPCGQWSWRFEGQAAEVALCLDAWVSVLSFLTFEQVVYVSRTCRVLAAASEDRRLWAESFAEEVDPEVSLRAAWLMRKRDQHEAARCSLGPHVAPLTVLFFKAVFGISVLVIDWWTVVISLNHREESITSWAGDPADHGSDYAVFAVLLC
eukprot:Hpha_TRINITY_DN35991_c0_g1::TRINITY_DN35991_c0_g1_i1::g.184968::m.184968